MDHGYNLADWIVLAVFAFAFIAVYIEQIRFRKSSEGWDYLVEKTTIEPFEENATSKFENWINRYGEDGWEIVQVFIYLKTSDTPFTHTVIFKRNKKWTRRKP